MTSIINILPEQVANQIAAGEVVDRPASAVKELLENAIDAGATNIQLIVKDAGRTLIQIIDNGCGMSDSDARLCIARHATSKIQRSDDLYAIRTMGFRGEALASIAAISQMEIRTRLHDAELGTCLTIEGGEVLNQEPCTCPVGTSIAVKNIFFNVPARRNFLKKDSIELSHVEEIFKRVCIVNHTIAFSLHSNGRPLYDLAGGSLALRLSNLYGNNFKERLYPISEESDVVTITGFVSKAEFAKKTRGEQYLFVNNRFIKHPALSAAVEKAYTDMIPDHHYPSYFLSLQVDPSRIDVNIHPTKTEVKFIDEHAIFAMLRAAAKKALGQFSLATEIEFDPPTDFQFTPAPEGYIPQQPQIKIDPHYNPFESHSTTSRSGYSAPQRHSSEPVSDRWKTFFESATEPVMPQSEETIEVTAAPSTSTPPSGTILQVQQRYLVSSFASGILVVDQHRAHERILFERLSAKSQQAQSAAQQLMFPVNCTFSPADADIINEMMPDIRAFGFDIAPLGKNTFVVSATPSDVKDTDLQALFDQMLVDCKGGMMQKFGDRAQSLCRSLAHQAAVKPGKVLQQEEMHQLIADLFCCKVPDLAPDGKKTLVLIPEQKLSELLG